MPAPEERLTTLEKTVALLQKRSSEADIQELNRNVTMLLGIVSSQQLDIKEIKIGLVTVEGRLDTVEEHLGNIEQRLNTLEHRVETGFGTSEKKLDQVLQLITTLTIRLDQEL